jgi:hypothetical protein
MRNAETVFKARPFFDVNTTETWRTRRRRVNRRRESAR